MVSLEREGLGVEVWGRELRHAMPMSTDMCTGRKCLSGDCDDKSLCVPLVTVSEKLITVNVNSLDL